LLQLVAMARYEQCTSHPASTSPSNLGQAYAVMPTSSPELCMIAANASYFMKPPGIVSAASE